MIVLGVAATWIAISIVGAKGLLLFARAVGSSEPDGERYRGAPQSGPGCDEAYRERVPAHTFGARP